MWGDWNLTNQLSLFPLIYCLQLYKTIFALICAFKWHISSISKFRLLLRLIISLKNLKLICCDFKLDSVDFFQFNIFLTYLCFCVGACSWLPIFYTQYPEVDQNKRFPTNNCKLHNWPILWNRIPPRIFFKQIADVLRKEKGIVQNDIGVVGNFFFYLTKWDISITWSIIFCL